MSWCQAGLRALHPRWRTPVNSIACMAVLVFLLLVLGTAGVHAQEAYQLLSNAGITHYEIAYLAMFAVPLVGARGFRKLLTSESLALRRALVELAVPYQNQRLALKSAPKMLEIAEAVP